MEKSIKNRVCRHIPVTDELANVLAERSVYLEKLESKMLVPYPYVVGDDLGNPLKPSYISNTWAERRPFPVRFHDLRHSVASNLANNGVHPRVVQELLGHTDIKTTLKVYTHLPSSALREALAGL